MADKESPVLYSAPNPNSIEAAVPADNVGMGQKDVGWNQRKEEGRQEIAAGTMDEGTGISERQRRMKTEIFIGGMSRETTEEDLRKVFGKVGEIVEIRFKTIRRTGKSKGYAFLRYREAAQAKRAISEFRQVKICGKLCGASALKGNDAILLGNIDKKWKDADVVKLLQNAEIEKIDTITMMANPTNANINSGNIVFAWAEPLNYLDEEEMQVNLKGLFAEPVQSPVIQNHSYTKVGEKWIAGRKRLFASLGEEVASSSDTSYLPLDTNQKSSSSDGALPLGMRDPYSNFGYSRGALSDYVHSSVFSQIIYCYY